MFTQLLDLFKITSTNVDLQLNNSKAAPGEELSGVFQIQGGRFKKKVKRLECDLVIEQPEEGTSKVVDNVKTVLMSKTLESNEKTEIPFSYELPKELVPSSDATSYRLHTKLIFTDDIKRYDHDTILVTKKTLA